MNNGLKVTPLEEPYSDKPIKVQATIVEDAIPLRQKKIVKVLLCLVFTIAFVIVGIFVGKLMLKRHKKHDSYATLKPGGGRDWSIDLEKKIITSKHNPDLVLGSLPLDPLVLTARDSAQAIKFSKPELDLLKKGVVSNVAGLDLQFHDHVDTLGDWNYLVTGVGDSNATSIRSFDESSLELEFIDSNFLLLHHKGSEWVLDVSFWIFEEGNDVNFIQAANEGQQTLLYGGGRDWVLNIDEGTISPKKHPELVLGRGSKSLLVVPSDSEALWTFGNLESLKNGQVMKLVNDYGIGAAKMSQEESMLEQWRYILSSVRSDDGQDDSIVQVQLVDDNFIQLHVEGQDEEKALVLDVAHWWMIPYNKVNYVGGSEYRPAS